MLNQAKSLKFSTWLVTGLFAVPLLVIFSSVFNIDTQVWSHLASTVLSDYVVNSLILTFGVGLGAATIGASSAWLMVNYEFIGKKYLSWLILLPLSMPAYIIAYTYTGIFDFAGPAQSFLRESFSLDPSARVLPDLRTLYGAIVMMILVLYPYVYLLARTAFSEQSKQFTLVAQLSGVSRWQYIKKVAIPLARPAILTGSALAMMEALADYGTVAYFGVNTFTTGIYRTWFGMGSAQAASQLASMLCIFVFALLWIEKTSRKDSSRYQARGNSETIAKPSTGLKSAILFILCLLPPLFGFILPFAQLMWWSVVYFDQAVFIEYLPLLFTSLQLAAISVVVIVSIALGISYCKRIYANGQASKKAHSASKKTAKGIQFASQFISLGYALPGVVIAVGVIQVAGFTDIKINELSLALFDYQPGLLISGSMSILVFAYAVRYLSVALHNTDTGLERIKSHYDEVAETLGASPNRVLAKIHLPLLRASILSASILVFVDVLKELPATLILRPFNVNTLAVKTYELASDERLIDAALPAVSIVLAGILPVILLTRSLEKKLYK